MASSSMVIQPQLQIVAQQQKFGSQSFIHSMAMLLGLQLLEYLPIEQQHKSSRRRRRRRNGMGEVAHRKLESSRPISFNVERKLRNFSASCYYSFWKRHVAPLVGLSHRPPQEATGEICRVANEEGSGWGCDGRRTREEELRCESIQTDIVSPR